MNFPVWASPSGYQVIANDCVVRLPFAVAVVSAGDVMEDIVVIGTAAKGVDCRIDESQGGTAVGDGLLIDQRKKSCPARCREAGATIVAAAGALVAGIVVGIRFHGNIRYVAHGVRSLIRGIGDASLPVRNGEAIIGRAAAAVRPRGFRLPGAACTVGG